MGEVFGGRYELVDLLDSGGAGTVWRAWDHRTSGYLAVKVLRQSDSDSLIRFVRETSRHIDHDHVLAPLGWSGEDDRVLFAMPLVRGGSVATLLGDFGALPIGWAIELFGQSLDALAAVHAEGVVHRDVKPANLLLKATGRDAPHVLLSDFGAAAKVGAPRLTHADLVIGTPGFLAPEQLSGADPAPSQDVYSLGVTVMHVLTGRPPPARGGLLPRPGGADRPASSLWDLLEAMTSNDPVDRPDVAEARLRLDEVRGPHPLSYGEDPLNPVEIFDQIPALPDGWGEDGPARQAAPPRGVTPSAHPLPTASAESARTELLARSDAEPEHPALEPDARPSATRAVPILVWVLIVVGVTLIVTSVIV